MNTRARKNRVVTKHYGIHFNREYDPILSGYYINQELKRGSRGADNFCNN